MKNNEKIYRELGEVNDEYIPVIEKRKNGLPLKLAALGTAAAVAGFLAVRNIDFGEKKLHIENTWQDFTIYSDNNFEEKEYGELPKIPFASSGEYNVSAENIVTVYDISDLDNANPWNEDLQLTSLPVFKNLSYKGSPHIAPNCFTEEKLSEIAEKAAYALGLEIGESSFSYDVLFKDNPYDISAVCGGEKYGVEPVEIEVRGNGDITISFGDVYSQIGFQLPDEYRFAPDTNEREAEKTLYYLIDRFKEFLQFENPVADIYQGDRGFTGESSLNFAVYNGSDDPVRSILNYFFDNAVFSHSWTYTEDENGGKVFNNQLRFIRRENKLSAAECMGIYPVITAEEAEEMLLSSNTPPDINESWYLDDGKIDREDIKKVELIYNNDNAEFYMPYYRFTVEVSCDGDWIADNLISYCRYTVPAVKSEYFFDDVNPALDSGVLIPFFASEITFPDGSVLRKSQAASTPPNDKYPVLEYDFGFLRFMDTYGNSYTGNDSWFKVKSGDILENGLTVESANYLVAWYGGYTHFYSSEVKLSGSVEAKGILYCYEEETENDKAGDLYFYPDTDNNTLPHMAGLLMNGPGTLGIYLGNIEDAYMSEALKELFKDGGDGEPLRLIVDLGNPEFFSSQGKDGERTERAEAEIQGFRTYESKEPDSSFYE